MIKVSRDPVDFYLTGIITTFLLENKIRVPSGQQESFLCKSQILWAPHSPLTSAQHPSVGLGKTDNPPGGGRVPSGCVRRTQSKVWPRRVGRVGKGGWLARDLGSLCNFPCFLLNHLNEGIELALTLRGSNFVKRWACSWKWSYLWVWPGLLNGLWEKKWITRTELCITQYLHNLKYTGK